MKYILPIVGVALHLFIVGFLIGFNGLFIIKMDTLTTLFVYIPLGLFPLLLVCFISTVLLNSPSQQKED